METLLVSKSKFSLWTWHMLMNKPKKDNISLNYILLRQDLSEGTIDSMERKNKIQKLVPVFSVIITKKRRRKNWVDKGNKKCRRSLKTLQSWRKTFFWRWVRLRLHFRNVYLDTWKLIFPVTGKILNTSTFTKRFNALHFSILEEIVRQPWFPKNIRNIGFLSILYGKTMREFRKPMIKIRDKDGISKYTLPFVWNYKP